MAMRKDAATSPHTPPAPAPEEVPAAAAAPAEASDLMQLKKELWADADDEMDFSEDPSKFFGCSFGSPISSPVHKQTAAQRDDGTDVTGSDSRENTRPTPPYTPPAAPLQGEQPAGQPCRAAASASRAPNRTLSELGLAPPAQYEQYERYDQSGQHVQYARDPTEWQQQCHYVAQRGDALWCIAVALSCAPGNSLPLREIAQRVSWRRHFLNTLGSLNDFVAAHRQQFRLNGGWVELQTTSRTAWQRLHMQSSYGQPQAPYTGPWSAGSTLSGTPGPAESAPHPSAWGRGAASPVLVEVPPAAAAPAAPAAPAPVPVPPPTLLLNGVPTQAPPAPGAAPAAGISTPPKQAAADDGSQPVNKPVGRIRAPGMTRLRKHTNNNHWVGTVRYGEKVDVVLQKGDFSLVRGERGAQGFIRTRYVSMQAVRHPDPEDIAASLIAMDW